MRNDDLDATHNEVLKSLWNKTDMLDDIFCSYWGAPWTKPL